ncbi:MAG: 1-acyl-sn-glycerol-3-phosphate acyltransferase [Planctomycetes bacterium]|nr:1-acyl-sn-glycerol-3-phosphate acyltransferase [Planctomycetota bacterium]
MTPSTGPAAAGQVPRPAGPMGPIEASARLLAVWCFTAAFILPAATFLVLTLGQLSLRLGASVARIWGRTVVRLLGIRFEIEGAERLAGRAPRILVFNHSSTLDLPVVSALCPDGALAIGKTELRWVPFIGLAWWALGHAFLDRGNPERARASIESIGRRLTRSSRTAMIAPEGTRSPDGRLQPFKMGAFHLARVSGAPIVPMLIEGAADCLPLGEWRVRPGRVRVRVLEPVPTAGWIEEDLRDRAESVRAIFARHLEPGGSGGDDLPGPPGESR